VFADLNAGKVELLPEPCSLSANGLHLQRGGGAYQEAPMANGPAAQNNGYQGAVIPQCQEQPEVLLYSRLGWPRGWAGTAVRQMKLFK
jgi:hypothetical protein